MPRARIKSRRSTGRIEPAISNNTRISTTRAIMRPSSSAQDTSREIPVASQFFVLNNY